jgi:hypothetical protein
MRFRHTSETDARIRRGYEAQDSVSSIAADTGFSVYAVIRRAAKIGLKYLRVRPKTPVACECGNHMFAAATKGFVIMVSPEDADVLEYRWKASISRRYVTIMKTSGDRGVIAREIMRPPLDMVVDHINGITVDNRRENLRVCTQAENMRNTKRHRANRDAHCAFARAA